ncbi:glutaredoxin [Guyanagaster necrorhizus]|uniref:Monothiol glutaredoxin-5, mitochondrial n=1 Tax=Guyanagaster necrorhizus TaxID=856835 RepID=A0A9P8AQU2_9AGAR|nr:glutaredoxin [Guyanagaster necrorhizus MCA 3950]KAG7444484.1 glutaredoxin [Guyanagaster necrorhizus MCA 3950]
MFGAVIRSSTGLLRSSVTTALTSSRTAGCRRFLSQEVRSKIQAAITETPVVLFMKGTPDYPQCGFSRAAIQILDLHNVPTEKMKTFDVLEDQELRTAIKEFSEWPTIPQLYVKGEFVGGCDILISMHQSGELEKLLAENEVVPKVEESTLSSA